MYRTEIVTHPTKLDALIKSQTVTVVNSQSVGPIGFKRYWLALDDPSIVLSLAAKRYQFVLLTDVLEHFNLNYFLEMCQLFLKMKLGAAPDDFEIIKMAQPRTTHIYPTYRDTWRNGIGFAPTYTSDYLYVGPEEEQLLFIQPLTLLGLRPVSGDPLYWKLAYENQVPLQMSRAVKWNHACVMRTEGFSSKQAEEIEATHMQLERAHREGLDREPPFQQSCANNACGFIIG